LFVYEIFIVCELSLVFDKILLKMQNVEQLLKDLNELKRFNQLIALLHEDLHTKLNQCKGQLINDDLIEIILTTLRNYEHTITE